MFTKLAVIRAIIRATRENSRNRGRWRAVYGGIAMLCILPLDAPAAISTPQTTTVSVLSRPLGRGDIIREADLETLEYKGGNANKVFITEHADLLGMSLKRPMRAGVPLRGSDIMVPIVVAKGEIVTMAFESPGISLKTRGKSLDDGVQGARVRVINMQTNRTVEATVSAPGYVLVSPPASNLAISAPGVVAAR